MRRFDVSEAHMSRLGMHSLQLWVWHGGRYKRPAWSIMQKIHYTPRHTMLNDVVWSVIKRAKIPTHKEPTELRLPNIKRPDGATLILASRGEALV